MGPGLGETFNTPDVLAEEGIEYVADWVNDDLPYAMKVKNGSLISIPYTLEINDITIYLIQQHRSSGDLRAGTRSIRHAIPRECQWCSRDGYLCPSLHHWSTSSYQVFRSNLRVHQAEYGGAVQTGSEILDWHKSVKPEKATRSFEATE
jgi:allantoinase